MFAFFASRYAPLARLFFKGVVLSPALTASLAGVSYGMRIKAWLTRSRLLVDPSFNEAGLTTSLAGVSSGIRVRTSLTQSRRLVELCCNEAGLKGDRRLFHRAANELLKEEGRDGSDKA